MEIHISDHFTYKSLLRFTFPSILMMIFVSVYGVVDGLFVSNFVGKTALACINIIWPFIMVIGGFGSMLGTGGGALVAKTLGEGDPKRAHRYFTMIIRLMIISCVLLSTLGFIFIRPIAYLLGASDALIEGCVTYGRTLLVFNTALVMQFFFQSLLITAEKPKLGLYVTIIAGLTNISLDALFIVVFKMGLFGAALATGLSQFAGGFVPLFYFLSKRNNSLLHFAKTKFEFKPMLKACTNGASEMLSTISGSLVGILYNRQLMHYIGENGVAAYSVMMYTAFIFAAIFIGYSSGSAPIVGYHFGAQNFPEVKNMLNKSLRLMTVSGILMTGLCLLVTNAIASIFVGYDEALLALTKHAFYVCCFCFLIMGVNIYASSFFTALNDGGVSASISALRSLVFQVGSITLMPLLFGVEGIWYSILVAEAFSLIVSSVFLLAKRKKYHY